MVFNQFHWISGCFKDYLRGALRSKFIETVWRGPSTYALLTNWINQSHGRLKKDKFNLIVC